MIETFLLEQLVCFAECGSLSAAARKLHITQPALSRSMKKLEEAFGVELFIRTHSQITLNETGKVAVEQARKVLAAQQEMKTRTLAFARRQHAIVFGACAALPADEVMPLLRDRADDTAITSELADDDTLINRLRKQLYHFILTHHDPDAADLFAQPFLHEQLYVTVPDTHPLASRTDITFKDLRGMSILAHGGSGFWLETCQRHIPEAKLIPQDKETLNELVDASTLPAFSSDCVLRRMHSAYGRKPIPICDEAAHVLYYLVCRKAEKNKYAALIQTARQLA